MIHTFPYFDPEIAEKDIYSLAVSKGIAVGELETVQQDGRKNFKVYIGINPLYLPKRFDNRVLLYQLMSAVFEAMSVTNPGSPVQVFVIHETKDTTLIPMAKRVEQVFSAL